MGKEPYGFGLHQSGGKVFMGPLGSEPLDIEGDEMVFGDKDGVSRSRYIGTIEEGGLEWE